MRKASKETQPQKAAHEPFRVRLPGLIVDKEVGLGDLIKRATTSYGIKPCGGCQRRAEALNRWFVIAGRSR